MTSPLPVVMGDDKAHTGYDHNALVHDDGHEIADRFDHDALSRVLADSAISPSLNPAGNVNLEGIHIHIYRAGLFRIIMICIIIYLPHRQLRTKVPLLLM